MEENPVRLSKIGPKMGGNWRCLNGMEFGPNVYIKNSNYNFV